jgi:hypothetical protein
MVVMNSRCYEKDGGNYYFPHLAPGRGTSARSFVMKMFVYAIFDTLALEYGPLFEAKNNNVALRSFNDLVRRSGRPEEYRLFCFGEVTRTDNDIEVGWYKSKEPVMEVANVEE